jgi:negative regulator of flagellin synthesis FlgM
MKVDHKIGSSLHHVDTAKTGKTSHKTDLEKMISSRGSDASEGSSKVDVSDRAQRMQRAKDIASRDTVDEAKVARLQKLIDEGKYKTDASAIADKLIDEHMSFPE